MTETTPDKPARAATPRAASPDLSELHAAIADLRKLLVDTTATLLTALAEQHQTIGALSALVQAALPAALMRLPHAEVLRLIQSAPQTRLRLLAPFQSSMVNLPAGTELAASDDRVRVHGRAMSLGLAIAKSDAPANAVRQLVQQHAAEIAQTAEAQKKAALAAAAAEAQARADHLTAAATGA